MVAAPATSAPVQVLTSRALFSNITDCIDGVPYHVLQLHETARNDPSVRFQFATRLWQAAVVCRNERALEALCKLSATPRYASSPHVAFLEVIGFAVLFAEGDLEFLEWLFERFCTARQRQIEYRTLNLLTNSCGEDLAVVQWLRSRGYEFPPSMMDAAAGSGNLALVRYLHEHGTQGCSPSAMDSAARSGRLDIVRFLHEHRREGCTLASLFDAESAGHDDVVDFLCRYRPMENCGAAIKEAARRGLVLLAAALACTLATPWWRRSQQLYSYDCDLPSRPYTPTWYLGTTAAASLTNDRETKAVAEQWRV